MTNNAPNPDAEDACKQGQPFHTNGSTPKFNRITLTGSSDWIKRIIHLLHNSYIAEAGSWSRQQPTQEPSEMISNVSEKGRLEMEGEETVSAEEIAESEAAWQDYLNGCDPGLTSDELKLKLFGKPC